MLNIYSVFKKGASLAAMLLLGASAQAQYCIPANVNGCGTPINPPTNTLFASIKSFATTGGLINITNNNQTPPCSAPSGYKLWTLGCKYNAGQTVTWTVQEQSNITAGFRIWVDWNRDFDFYDLGEACTPGSVIFSPGPGTATSPTFVVPGYAKQGKTRMRIRHVSLLNGNVPVTNLDPCNTYYGGETEDYEFEVVNPCLKPAVTSVANVTWNSADFSWQPRLNAISYEYTIDTSPNNPVGNGYAYVGGSTVHFPDNIHPPLVCNTKYYVHIRSVCDSTGPTQGWETSAWGIDSFTTDQCCNTPEVTISDNNATTALAKWGAVPSVVKYEYAVGTTPNNPPLTGGTITTYPSIFMQGLTCNTVYYFYIRALCSPTPRSDWGQTMFPTGKCLDVAKVNLDRPAILAYPNPVSNMLTIALTSGIGGSENITLTDINGKVLRQIPVTSEKMTVDMTDLPSGLYLVRYKDEQRSQVIKVTKQ